jgi:hypothetical protein
VIATLALVSRLLAAHLAAPAPLPWWDVTTPFGDDDDCSADVEGPESATGAARDEWVRVARARLVKLDCEVNPSECTVNYYGRSE